MMLIERQEAIGRLRTRLATFEDSSAVSMIVGPPAVGKSAVLREFRRVATAEGHLALGAGGAEDEQDLPLGLIGQLFCDPRLPARLVELVRTCADQLAATDDQGDPAAPLGPVASALARELHRYLLEQADSGGLVLCIDDLQFADRISQQVLLYLARRMHGGGLMAVVAAPSVEDITLPALHAEIVRHPCFEQITLSLLSVDGVGQMLAEQSYPTCGQLAGSVHALSGGNPLLVKALMLDGHAGSDPAPQPRPGRAFRDAVLGAIGRFDDSAEAIVQAAAVLGQLSNAGLIGDLLSRESGAIDTTVRDLSDSGLMTADGYCQPAVGDIVLADTDPAFRANLRGRAARLADENGCGAAVVAEHLIAAGRPCESWAGRTLTEAAAQAEASEEPAFAIDCLELAARSTTDETERARIVMDLARIEWRHEPSTAARHLGGLVDAALTGRLAPSDVADVTGWLLWLGRADEATRTIDWIFAAAERTADPAVRAALTTLRGQFPLSIPAVAGWSLPQDVSDIPVELAAHAGIVATGVLARALSQVPDDRIHARAEQVLANCELSDDTLPAVVAALQALIYTDRLEAAQAWCTALMDVAAQRPAATWEGVLGALRAELAWRHGDLTEALRWSDFALDRISRRGWGVAIGLPMAVRLQALLGTGQMDEAAVVARAVLPEETYRTRYGLTFLYARAQFHLATNKFHLAQADFARCAELSAQTESDLPALVPWRTGYARLHLKLEHGKAAVELMAAQLARPGGQGARVRGQSLCVIAVAGEPRRRPTLLREAIDLLQVSGDRAGLANALAELSTAYQDLSEFTRARLMSRRAQEVAADCGTTASCRSLLTGVTPSAPGTTEIPDQGQSPDVLSDAERRVAELAVMGHTNREIGNKLFITVSTVEQHLTRIYRKLGVTRRVDLPIRLRHSDRAGTALLSAAG
ncbi:DNA-binding CsgD family transcriptional regulator [Nakamurella sp. UYEF19]|uniref:helix-turn-helix transcriptional regulator n=1 Tax=Nakamurella sp. UYEF19 TaxID=1756392 RepID=UPI00339900C5